MKRLFFIFSFLAAGFFLFSSFAQAEQLVLEEEKVIIHLFDDRLCPVCRDAKSFIQSIEQDYSQIELRIYPISDITKLREIAEEYGVEDYGIMAPSIFIGDNFFQFRDFTSRHEEMIIRAIEGEIIDDDCCIIRIPFLNIELDIRGWSLPLMTMILSSLDGLNICSIGALILILSIVIIFESKKKIFFFGGLFILTTAVVYGILVFTWGRLFEVLVGQLEILRIIVGLAALGGGIYFFKEFWRFFKYGPTCQVSDSALAKKATEKLKKSFEDSKRGSFRLAGAIMFFAIVIILVELPCSIGLPVAFTGILIEAGIPLSSYIFYILLYLFFYMLIEIIIFVGAVLTKKIWFADSRVITWITFIGAVVLFYLAYYYLFT
jgi:thiol-disulfide isomerase/thioredoxin